MVDVVATQTLFDGTRRAVMKFLNTSDGSGETNVTKVDVSALNAHPRTGAACTEVRIEKITYMTTGDLSVQILWNADSNELALELPRGMSDAVDMCDFGGLVNNAGTGKNGDVLFTTVGATADDSYSVILEMVKTYG